MNRHAIRPKSRITSGETSFPNTHYLNAEALTGHFFGQGEDHKARDPMSDSELLAAISLTPKRRSA